MESYCVRDGETAMLATLLQEQSNWAVYAKGLDKLVHTINIT